jgi:8-oxo-dGTP pyrophosphatase MutT (NUDIX family)
MNQASSKNPFTIRVYGLLIHKGHIMLSSEWIQSKVYTKFPGGGLEYGEGTLDCLRREFREETGLDIKIQAHFYTTESFVPSAFLKGQQVFSIYYQVSCPNLAKRFPKLNEAPAPSPENPQVLGWVDLKSISEGDVDLPIDKKVVQMLLETAPSDR